MKRSIYLSDDDEQVLDLLVSTTGDKVSTIINDALRVYAVKLGYVYTPASWKKGGE